MYHSVLPVLTSYTCFTLIREQNSLDGETKMSSFYLPGNLIKPHKAKLSALSEQARALPARYPASKMYV